MSKLIDKLKQIHQSQNAKTAGVDLSTIFKNPIHFIASGFGVGILPMPGTFGTLVGALIAWLIYPLPVWLYVVIVVILNLVGIYLCAQMNRDLGTEDHPAAAWDEVAAFPIVMIAVPFTWYYLLIGFILFRFFDIVKPGPIGWLDKNVHGGLGVVLDDVVSALVSWLILLLIVWLF